MDAVRQGSFCYQAFDFEELGTYMCLLLRVISSPLQHPLLFSAANEALDRVNELYIIVVLLMLTTELLYSVGC